VPEGVGYGGVGALVSGKGGSAHAAYGFILYIL
jgi:hypothetical protein